MDFEFGVISAGEYDQIKELYEPLAEADADTIMRARQTIDKVSEVLEAEGVFIMPAWARESGGPERSDSGVVTA